MSETGEKILGLKLNEHSQGGGTIHGWLEGCLKSLIRDGEGFSGKRPYGNSGWFFALAEPMIEKGIASGKLGEDGFVEECDNKEIESLLIEAVQTMCGTK